MAIEYLRFEAENCGMASFDIVLLRRGIHCVKKSSAGWPKEWTRAKITRITNMKHELSSYIYITRVVFSMYITRVVSSCKCC